MVSLIDIEGWTRKDLAGLFALADDIGCGGPAHGDGAAGLFLEHAALPVRVALERAVWLSGLQPVLLPADALEIPSGLSSAADELSGLLELLVVAHPDPRVVRQLARADAVPLINAGSEEGSPCEVLGELYALRAMGRDPLAQRIVLVAAGGPLVRSWSQAAQAFGLDVVQACPDELADPGLRHSSNLFATLRGAGLVVTTDPGDSAEQMAPYRIEPEYLVVAAPDCLVAPAPPFAWGRELSAQLRDAPDGWVGHGFRRHQLALDRAVIAHCLG